jgi:LPXTG-motif cell wall-anchored protein
MPLAYLPIVGNISMFCQRRGRKNHMQWKMSAGVIMALAFLIPAAPAVAQTGQPGLNDACQTVERKVFKDIRELVTIDLDTATDVEVRVLANQILAAATAESLPVLPGAVQERLDGTADDLRAFLKADWQNAWSTDLRISVGRTLTGAGAHVQAAAQKALSAGAIDAYLAYLNDGLYAARALDCASQPTATPSVTPSATTTAAPIPTLAASLGTSGGEGGGLAVTGADTGIVASIGGALLLLGGAGYLIGRRRRSRFVA